LIVAFEVERPFCWTKNILGSLVVLAFSAFSMFKEVKVPLLVAVSVYLE
jgi:hypothetical protein